MTDVTFIIVIGSGLFLAMLLFIVTFLFLYQKRHSDYLTKTQNLEAKFSQTLLESQLEIKEQTLTHVSHELHDNLGQIASLIKINLNTVNLTDVENTKIKLANIKDLIRQLISDIKAISLSLGHDRIIQIGLDYAIEMEIDRLNKTGQFIGSLTRVGEITRLDNAKTVIIFRIVQEALNNAIKHSNAKHISVAFKMENKILTLIISDDGVGFSPNTKIDSICAGLDNMRQRAKLISASFSLNSQTGIGTTVSLSLEVS